jgi:hypothetical protein
VTLTEKNQQTQKIHPNEFGMLHMPTHLSCFYSKFLSLEETLHTIRTLKLRKLPVQQQNGTLDCELFAVAYAVEVCTGNPPADVSFNQKTDAISSVYMPIGWTRSDVTISMFNVPSVALSEIPT